VGEEMNKNKKTKLYRIYRIKLNAEKEIISTEETKIVFIDEKEADEYCNHLNVERCLKGDNIKYCWAAEEVAIIKKAKDLIEDSNEDAILFS
jgi:hypothetical protein